MHADDRYLVRRERFRSDDLEKVHEPDRVEASRIPGSIVWLASGSPDLTLLEVLDDIASVTWKDGNGERQLMTISHACLRGKKPQENP